MVMGFSEIFIAQVDISRLAVESEFVQNRDVLHRQTEIERRIKMKIKNAEQEGHVWQNEVKGEAKCLAHVNKLINMMTKFHHVWDDHLGCMIINWKRIGLKSGKSKPIECALQGRGPRALEFQWWRFIGCWSGCFWCVQNRMGQSYSFGYGEGQITALLCQLWPSNGHYWLPTPSTLLKWTNSLINLAKN